MTGLEPAASGVTGQRSNQLSYTPLTPLSNLMFIVCYKERQMERESIKVAGLLGGASCFRPHHEFSRRLCRVAACGSDGA